MKTIRVTGKGQMKVHPDMTRIAITLGLFSDCRQQRCDGFRCKKSPPVQGIHTVINSPVDSTGLSVAGANGGKGHYYFSVREAGSVGT